MVLLATGNAELMEMSKDEVAGLKAQQKIILDQLAAITAAAAPAEEAHDRPNFGGIDAWSSASAADGSSSAASTNERNRFIGWGPFTAGC